ncbi:hypothetical protein MMC30_002242 [Trapelia coarctata]|nr:hypothetical protein [Trapelia coarctata]
MLTSLSCISAAAVGFSFTVSAREIIFPEVAASHPYQSTLIGNLDGIDIVSGSQFSGLTTFANLPYASCFGDGPASEKYDIALLGAPFDTGATARPGARFGPGGIRLGSRRLSPRSGWSVYTGENSLEDWAKIVDCGDAPLTFLDNTVALKQLEKAHKLMMFSLWKVISGRTANTTTKSSIPRVITLGGDHTTTLAALRSTYGHWGKVSVIHFDSHIGTHWAARPVDRNTTLGLVPGSSPATFKVSEADHNADTWDPKAEEYRITRTFLHLAHEEGLILNMSMHAGIRAPLIRPKGDIRNDLRCGFEIVTARDIDRLGVDGVLRKLRNRVGETNVYVSVDIDVLDPAFAPATGTAEVGGWSTRELLTILDGLRGIRIIGADVVEVAPIYDNPGETTVLAAAEVAHSLITLMVQTPVQSEKDRLA